MDPITDSPLPSFSLHSSSANSFFTTTNPLFVLLPSSSSSSANSTAASECYVPETLEMVPWTSVQYFLIGLYSCTSLLALLGNLTVILVSTLGSESAPTIRLCLANLAVSDIILAVLCVPFTFTDFMWGQCFVPFGAVQLLSVFVTSLTLCIIGVERYHATLRPFSAIHRWLCTHTRLLLTLTWIGGSLYAYIPFENTGTRAFTLGNETYYECSYDIGVSVTQRRIFMATNLLLTFLLPLLVLVTAYTAIMRKLLADQSPSKGVASGGTVLQVKAFQTTTTTKNSSNGCTGGGGSLVIKKSPGSVKKLTLVAKSSADGKAVLAETTISGSAENSPNVTNGEGLRVHGGKGGSPLKSRSVVNLRKSANANRSKTIKMLFMVMALYGICWAPIKLYQFLLDYGVLSYCSQFSLQAIVATYFSCHWLAMANSAVNPIIYSWMSVNFRNDFRRITSSCRPGKSRALVKGSRHYSLKTASTMV
ncbi:hypothetical protein TYRP_021490, partial [Tyrophagus putrescentiae]